MSNQDFNRDPVGNEELNADITNADVWAPDTAAAETPTNFLGNDVIDEHGESVGIVSDVLFDDATMQPQWLVVNPGPLRAEHYVPAEASYTTEDGKVVIPFDKQTIKEAPKAKGDHIVTAELEAELSSFYDTARSD